MSGRDHGPPPANRRAALTAAGRVALVLFFCAGIAFLGLLTGGDHPQVAARQGGDVMAGYYGPDMPRYPGAQEMPAGPLSEIGGTKVRMSFFSTEDEPAQVARFYANFWRERRYFVRDDTTHMGGVVSAVDSTGGQVLQALMVARGGRTSVFPSVTKSPLAAMEQQAGQRPVVPLFPGSRAVINLGSEEGSTKARVSLSVNEGSLADNITHYARELSAAGYHKEADQQPRHAGEGHHVLLFFKEGSEVTVNLTALSEKQVRVHLMEVGT